MTFDEIVQKALRMVQEHAPYKKGDLSRSFHLVDYGTHYGIRTEMPYMVYTNEEWKYNSRWGKTLPNPRKGWFDMVVLLITEMVATHMGGTVHVIT